MDIYHPDMVVFHIFADNDFGDIIRNRLFELDTAGNLVETGHRKTRDQHLKQKQGFGNFASTLLSVRAVRKVAGLAKRKERMTKTDVIQQYISTLEKEYAVYQQSQLRHFSHFEDHYDMDIALFPDAESSKTKVRLMEGVLKEAKALGSVDISISRTRETQSLSSSWLRT